MVLSDKLRDDSGLENEKSFFKKTSNFEQNAYFWLDWKGGGWWEKSKVFLKFFLLKLISFLLKLIILKLKKKKFGQKIFCPNFFFTN